MGRAIRDSISHAGVSFGRGAAVAQDGSPFAGHLASHGHPGDQVGALIVPDRGFVYSLTRWGMRKGRAAHGPEALWVSCPVAQLRGTSQGDKEAQAMGTCPATVGPCLP